MIDDIMEKVKYDNMKRTVEDRTKWICRRKQQMDIACQEPPSSSSSSFYFLLYHTTGLID